MPRNPREKLNTSFFHVMSQEINKSYIFDEENEIKYYIKLLYEKKTKYNINLISYCIIEEYLKNRKLEEVLKNKEELKQLVSYLKKDKRISFRKMEKELRIGRETLRKLL